MAAGELSVKLREERLCRYRYTYMFSDSQIALHLFFDVELYECFTKWCVPFKQKTTQLWTVSGKTNGDKSPRDAIPFAPASSGSHIELEQTHSYVRRSTSTFLPSVLVTETEDRFFFFFSVKMSTELTEKKRSCCLNTRMKKSSAAINGFKGV